MSIHQFGAEIGGARVIIDVNLEEMFEWFVGKIVFAGLFFV